MTLLRIDGLTCRYGGVHALHEFTLDVPAGTRNAIIGANGAGKSTLLHLIAGTVRPTAGRILFDGHDITRARAAARARRGIGRTFQHPAIFERLSVAANVALAITRHTQPTARRLLLRRHALTAKVRAVLHDAHLSDHTDTAAGTLSYGQRRRLEMALALAAQPRLLLLDEPSAGLDPDEVNRLAATIRALPTTITVLLVDHHLDLVFDIADTVTVLHHGRHLATGTPTAIRANPEVQAAYLTPPRPRATRTAPDGAGDRPAAPLLRVRNLTVGYHGAPVLHHLDIDLAQGEVLAVLGRNGAGKTTLLNALAGILPFSPRGMIELAGSSLPTEPHRIARSGLALVPQGRRLFNLTVAEHLTAATAARPNPVGYPWTGSEILALLPPLRARLHHHAAHLSGGEQHMLALARALLSCPKLLLLDEPSEGLAPAIIEQLTTAIQLITAHGVSVLIAEQNLHLALELAHRAIVLDHGRIALDTPSNALSEHAGRRRLDNLLGVVPTGAP